MKLRVPKHSHHKPTGQAFVKIRGRFIYLGKYGSSESQQRYKRVIGEYLASGTATAKPSHSLKAASSPSGSCSPPTWFTASPTIAATVGSRRNTNQGPAPRRRYGRGER